MTAQRITNGVLALGWSSLVVGVALAASLGIVTLTGHPIGATSIALLEGALGGRQAIATMLQKAVPLTLVALGWIVAYSAFRVNIGFEGQIVMGGIAAAAIGLGGDGLPRYVHLPLAVVAGAASGAVYAGVAAWLWARRNVNEIISTLLLNFVAIQVLSWLLWGPLQTPEGSRAETAELPWSARWPRVFSDAPLTWDILFIPLLVGAVAFMLTWTTFGFRLRLTGANEVAARYAGIRTVRVGVWALVLSGTLAGLAGSSLALGSQSETLAENFSANYGFDGIIVALLARNAPVGVVPAAILFAALRQGGTFLEATVGVSQSLMRVTQGLVMVLLAASAFFLERQSYRGMKVQKTVGSSSTLAEA